MRDSLQEKYKRMGGIIIYDLDDNRVQNVTTSSIFTNLCLQKSSDIAEHILQSDVKFLSNSLHFEAKNTFIPKEELIGLENDILKLI